MSNISLLIKFFIFQIPETLTFLWLSAPPDLGTNILNMWVFFRDLLSLLFLAALILRIACLLPPPLHSSTDLQGPRSQTWPRYSIICALYKEADALPDLMTHLSQIDYPADRLQILLAVECDDHDTILAFERLAPKGPIQLVLVPNGYPKTKPRALNHAMDLVEGEFVTIYDAEDAPHPQQLKAAVLAFEGADPSLVCLQCPLRIEWGSGFFARHFQAEYAALFEVILPALARLGLPFPLGGTSNHFRVQALRAMGGWDAFNVTEDAELGVRLSQNGYRQSSLWSPTFEYPPETLKQWLPQRTRWLKGYMQTLVKYLGQIHKIPIRHSLSFGLSLGMTLLSALIYLPSLALIAWQVSLALMGNELKLLSVPHIVLFIACHAISVIAIAMGQRRQGGKITPKLLIELPFYWSLMSIAAYRAVFELLIKPHYWAKTYHPPRDKPLKSQTSVAA